MFKNNTLTLEEYKLVIDKLCNSIKEKTMKPNELILIFYQDNQVNQNNIKFRKKHNIPIWEDNTGIELEEYPMWALQYENVMKYYFDSNPLKRNKELKNLKDFIKFADINKIYTYYTKNTECLKNEILALEINIDFNQIYDYSDLFKKVTTLPRISTHFGCIYNCIFCNSIDKKITYNDLFEKQLNYIKTNINTNWLYLGNKSYGQIDTEFLMVERYLKDYNLIVQTRSDIILGEHHYIFNDKNIKMIELGIESFDDDILKSINKNITSEISFKAIDKLSRLGKIVIPNILLNTPYHKPSTYEKDYNVICDLLENQKITYFNINNMADYNSDDIIDWEQNIPIKSWNNPIQAELASEWYDKFVKLQTSLLV